MKKLMTIKTFLSGIALAAMVLPSIAHAIPAEAFSYMPLNTVYTGYTPDGTSPPWLTASFSASMLEGNKTGTLTLTSNLSDSDFLQGLSSNTGTLGWGFYMMGNSIASLTCTSGTCADTQLYGGSYNSGSVPGPFNLAFGWKSNNRFAIGDSATYSITFTNAITNSPFTFNDAGLISVAHVQGITGGCSGWIVAGLGDGNIGGQGTACVPTTTVPEPQVLGMFGIGLLTLAVLVDIRRRRRIRSEDRADPNR